MRVESRARPSRSRAGIINRELVIALVLAWMLVLARNAVYLLYEHSFFDSDQAIFGLMAQHIVEGRAWPLFCYGQNYMLAVDAWIAALVFVFTGPSVAALHASLVLMNLAVVTVLIVALWRWSNIRPLRALLAISFFAFAPPLTAASLAEAAGNVGPFLYIPLLWLLRDRPFWFGVVLAAGVLHREFTIYAVPVLLVLQARSGALWQLDRWKRWLVAIAVALVTWQGVQALRPYADSMGPDTRGRPVDGGAGIGVGSVTSRVEIVPKEMPDRAYTMLRQHFPGMVGARFVENPIAPQGHDWLFWPLMAALVSSVGFITHTVARDVRRATRVQSAAPDPLELPFYLFGVGALAVLGYVVTRPSDFFIDRYMLLALYVPIGTTAFVFATPRAPSFLRWGTVVACLLVMAGSATDHVRLAARYWNNGQPNDLRQLADGLVRRGVTVAQAGYWRAYKITFLTGERVKVASSDVVRIDEYQRLAAAQGDRLIVIQDRPCPGGVAVSLWYLCRRDGQPIAGGR